VSEYQDYKARFDKNRAALQIPPDCTAHAPQYSTFDPIAPTTWDLRWLLTFTDKHYIRCREFWSCRTNPSLRHIFTFHYGPIVNQDATGKIDRHHTDPVLIRFDKKGGGPPHLHYRKPEPHYDQSRVQGLALDDVDMFQFVNAVFSVRAGKTDFHDVLGFTLK
jgi:hypothetical protein